MTDTANLGLPCIEGSQAQKHVTHNDALRILDTLVQLAVLDRDLTAPPGSPVDGQSWIVKTGASGAWASHVDAIASWQDGVWQFSAPRIGWLAYVIDENAIVAWDGGAWISAIDAMTPTALNNMTLLGVGTTADSTNPLSAKLNNALFAAKTLAEGGDGNLRYKLSKESAAKTLSLLFQDNFSGRAEIGLTGDDDFHFKVSADGTSWHDGIVISATSGAVTLPNTTLAGGRETLATNRTYYVRTDGSDSNNGLSNTSGGAFLTIQKAIDAAVALDLSIYSVTIQLGNGTYTAANTLKSYLGVGPITILGDTTTPSNVVISTASANCVDGDGLRGKWIIRGVKLQTTTSGTGLNLANNSIVDFDSVDFGPCAQYHISALSGARVTGTGNYSISGNAVWHWSCADTASVTFRNHTLTITGTPAFSGNFALATRGGVIVATSNTYSGSATGSRYSATLNGVISTSGATLPGSSAGSTATGGQYS